MAKHIPIMRPRFGASDGKTGKKKKSKVTEVHVKLVMQIHHI